MKRFFFFLFSVTCISNSIFSMQQSLPMKTCQWCFKDILSHLHKFHENECCSNIKNLETCIHCGEKGFGTMTKLYEHERPCNGENLSEIRGERGNKYLCKGCSLGFTNTTDWQKHERHCTVINHTDSHPFRCQHSGCRKKFKTIQHKNEHEKKCAINQECPHCHAKKFSTLDELNEHVKRCLTSSPSFFNVLVFNYQPNAIIHTQIPQIINYFPLSQISYFPVVNLLDQSSEQTIINQTENTHSLLGKRTRSNASSSEPPKKRLKHEEFSSKIFLSDKAPEAPLAVNPNFYLLSSQCRLTSINMDSESINAHQKRVLARLPELDQPLTNK